MVADLVQAAVAGVPFVDIMVTMCDPSIPLTITEWEEWGNPNEQLYHDYMQSYRCVSVFLLSVFQVSVCLCMCAVCVSVYVCTYLGWTEPWLNRTVICRFPQCFCTNVYVWSHMVG